VGGEVRSLVTGAFGFIGKHLTRRLPISTTLIGSKTEYHMMEAGLVKADTIYHLAGANRPEDITDFEKVNVFLTKSICDILTEYDRNPRIIFASSIQAESDTPYGRTKRRAEDILKSFGETSGADIHIYRLRNVFGPGCRPNYNSVVATFCYNIAHGLPIKISDPSRKLELVYVKDVVNAFLRLTPPQDIPYTEIAVADLAECIKNFRLGIMGTSEFQLQLYRTYIYHMSRKYEYSKTVHNTCF
jgi:UDP-2-acetamido-2,6-beta-L-arabino-hexul-4-ose reductase